MVRDGQFLAHQQVDQAAVIQGGRRHGGHLAAVPQHGHVPGDREDLVQPVGDVEDADPRGRDPPDDLHQPLDLGRRQGGGRLVEDQEAHRGTRVLAQGTGDGHPGPGGRGQAAHAGPGINSQAHPGQVFSRPLTAAPGGYRAQPGREAGPDGQVVQHRDAVHQAQILVHEAGSQPVRAGRVPERQRLARDGDGAGIGPVEAGEDLDEGGFPGPVLAEHGVHLAGADREIHVLEGDAGAEALAQPGDRQGRGDIGRCGHRVIPAFLLAGPRGRPGRLPRTTEASRACGTAAGSSPARHSRRPG